VFVHNTWFDGMSRGLTTSFMLMLTCRAGQRTAETPKIGNDHADRDHVLVKPSALVGCTPPNLDFEKILLKILF
jgi:hypothetical protein